MPIQAIVRDWGTQPAIVRIYTTDSLALVSAPGYITSQASAIYTANSGDFEWLYSDVVLVWSQNQTTTPYSSSWGLFTINNTFTGLNPFPGSQSLTANVTLTAAEVIAAYATPQLLIAAPGTGNAIFVSSAQIVTTVSTAFTAGGVGNVQYGATVHGAGYGALDTTTPTAEITAASSQIYTQYGLPTTTVSTFADVANLGIYFSNATQAFATGTGSTVAFNLQYTIISGV